MRRAEVKKATGNAGFIRARGLPYGCKKEDILGFFEGKNHFQSQFKANLYQ
jgi:hypothetical protein